MPCYKTLTISLLLAISSLALSGQTQSGEITYGVKLNKSAFEKLDREYQQKREKNYFGSIIKKLQRGFPALQLRMTFNRSKSKLEAVKSMEKDGGVDMDLVAKISGAGGVFYTDLDKKVVIRQKRSLTLEKNYRIERPLEDFQWKMTKKTKLIKGYTCYKATRTVHNSYGDSKTTAWFCPAIPFQYGPIGFCGLPGLILEMNHPKYFDFYVKTVKFEDRAKNIPAPTKGELISKSRYDDLVNQKIKEEKKELEEAKKRYEANHK